MHLKKNKQEMRQNDASDGFLLMEHGNTLCGE